MRGLGDGVGVDSVFFCLFFSKRSRKSWRLRKKKKKKTSIKSPLFSLLSLSLSLCFLSLSHIGEASPARPSLIEQPPLSRTTTLWAAAGAVTG